MIRYSLLVLFSIFTLASHAQTTNPAKENIERYYVEPVAFKLYETSMPDNFLKLDTRNGKIWILQHHTKKEYQFTSPQNSQSLIGPNEDEKNGRFILQGTSFINRYLLLDQISGRVWQVDWARDISKRKITEIPQ